MGSTLIREMTGVCRAVAVAVGLVLGIGLPHASLAQPAGIEPEAARLLKASTDFVASRQMFSLEARSTIEAVLVSGQKIQFDHGASVAVQRPNRMRAERSGDLVKQVFQYDGKSLTLHNLDTGHYATVAAPATLEEMLDFASETLGIVAPASDLIGKNAHDALMQGVESGFVVGKAVIEGVRCDHLAFRAPHVDWQIWIQEGEQPLPRKLVITTRDIINAPQFSVVVTKWNLCPSFSDRTFAFSPPQGASRVEFLPAAAVAR